MAHDTRLIVGTEGEGEMGRKRLSKSGPVSGLLWGKVCP